MPATGPVGGDTRRAVTTVSTPPPLHEHHVPLPAGHELSVRERAGDQPFTVETIAALDADNPDLALDFEPHVSEIW